MDVEQGLVLQVQQPFETRVSDEFPAGLRMLVVDTDLSSSLVMENMMKQCSYKVTLCHGGEEALSSLRTSKDKFDMVVWDLHTHGTDGFEALQTIGSEFDLPVIITSSDHEREAVMKATMYGACDYLVKPVSKETLAVIWQHIVRKKTNTGPVRPVTDQTVGSGRENNAKSNTRGGNDEENEADEEPASKKHRMTWTDDLHRKFLEAVNKIGIEKAVPKQILKCMQEMKVQGLTRSNVASHLQKYRLSLQRNYRFPHETADFRCSTEPNASASKPSSIFDQSNILSGTHTFFSNHVMNSTVPELPKSYIPANNTFMNNTVMNNPQSLPQFPHMDHPMYSSFQLPSKVITTEEFGLATLDGGHPELIDTSMLDCSDLFQDPFACSNFSESCNPNSKY